MIAIRRILGLLALAGTIGLGAESRAQAQTVQPKSAGVATAVLEIQFARLLLGQEQQSISSETTLIRQQNQALSRPGQLSTAIQLQSQLDLSIQQARATEVRIDQTLASVDPSALQSSPSLARQFQSLEGQLALIQTQMAPIIARPPFGGHIGGRPPATPFR